MRLLLVLLFSFSVCAKEKIVEVKSDVLLPGEIPKEVNDHQMGIIIKRLSVDLLGEMPNLKTLKVYQKLFRDKGYVVLVDSMLSDKKFSDYLATRINNYVFADELKEFGFSRKVGADSQLSDFLSKSKFDFRSYIDEVVKQDSKATFAKLSFKWEEAPVQKAKVFSAKILGVPLHCAECHDHKNHEEIKQEYFWALVRNMGPKEKYYRSAKERLKDTNRSVLRSKGLFPFSNNSSTTRFEKWLRKTEVEKFIALRFTNEAHRWLIGSHLVSGDDLFGGSNDDLDSLGEAFVKNGFNIKKLFRSVLLGKSYLAGLMNQNRQIPAEIVFKKLYFNGYELPSVIPVSIAPNIRRDTNRMVQKERLRRVLQNMSKNKAFKKKKSKMKSSQKETMKEMKPKDISVQNPVNQHKVNARYYDISTNSSTLANNINLFLLQEDTPNEYLKTIKKIESFDDFKLLFEDLLSRPMTEKEEAFFNKKKDIGFNKLVHLLILIPEFRSY